MKILIAYFSKTGNTKRVAIDLAKKLNAETDEIIDLQERQFLNKGRDAAKGLLTKIKTTKNPSDYDLVIIGSPVWAFNSTPATRTYITNFKNEFKKVAIFTTSGLVHPKEPVVFLEKILGKKSISFEGWNRLELSNKKTYTKKLENFAKKILDTMNG